MTDTVKITLRNLPKPLHAALKKIASANRHSLNDEVMIAIENHLAANATRKTALSIAKAMVRTIGLPAPKRAKGKVR